MAPAALSDLFDTSDYTPSNVTIAQSLQELGSGYKGAVYALNSSDDGSLELGRRFFCELSAADILAIEQAVSGFHGTGLPLNAISRLTFKLDIAVALELEKVARKVQSSQGFMIITGIDPSKYTQTDNVIIHAGLTAYIGGMRAMPGRAGKDRTVLHHVVNLPKPSSDEIYHGPPNESRDMPFHTDDGDITSLFMVSKSDGQIGGSLHLADSTAVYESIAAHWPDSASVLRADWTFISEKPAQHAEVRPLVFQRPTSDRIWMNCARARLTGTQSRPRPASVPALTKLQVQALDRLHATAKVKSIAIDLQMGDMVVFDNLSMLHARDSFEDDMNDIFGRKRHLLRLIVQNEDRAACLPKPLQEKWRALFDHDSGEEIFNVAAELFSDKISH